MDVVVMEPVKGGESRKRSAEAEGLPSRRTIPILSLLAIRFAASLPDNKSSSEWHEQHGAATGQQFHRKSSSLYRLQ